MINRLKEAGELLSFQIFYRQRRSKATWVLAAIIIAMYLLEEFYGGSTDIYVLIGMGANVRSLVAQGEYSRLMSSVFLHAGFMHVFFNSYVLIVLGGFFNKILGESKYLSIFFISGISGSLASLALGKAEVSVGASGAIWGLFGASLALAIFKTDLIPEALRLALRKTTIINLLINLGVSFLPMVDFWAHIGGGVGGFICSTFIIWPVNTMRLEKIRSKFFQLTALILGSCYILSIIGIWWKL